MSESSMLMFLLNGKSVKMLSLLFDILITGAYSNCPSIMAKGMPKAMRKPDSFGASMKNIRRAASIIIRKYKDLMPKVFINSRFI